VIRNIAQSSSEKRSAVFLEFSFFCNDRRFERMTYLPSPRIFSSALLIAPRSRRTCSQGAESGTRPPISSRRPANPKGRRFRTGLRQSSALPARSPRREAEHG
jgi:hypothetical protein